MKHLKMKIAMCVFALCAAVAVATFSSCSNEEPVQAEISESAVTSSELVASIVSFNDSLSSCVSQTRSWDGFLRVVGIASADIAGAYELGKIGAGVGSFFAPGAGTAIGGAIGGVLGGAGASYLAAEQTRVSISQVSQTYAQVKLDWESKLSEDWYEQEINLELPTDKQKLLEIGKDHNLIMDGLRNHYGQDAFDDILDSLRIKTKSEVNVDYVNAFDSISLAVMKDPSFNQSYEEMLDIVSTKSPKEFIQASGVTYDEVVRLYLDILNTSREKLEDVEFITNKYIELIEKSNELTEAEKDNIYMAFSVAAASVEYWNKNYTE